MNSDLLLFLCNIITVATEPPPSASTNTSAVMIHFFRRVGNTVHDALHVAADRSQRRFQIMGDVADQLAVLFFVIEPLLGIVL